MTSVGRSGADSSPLLLQDIAAPMLARDLYDLCPAQRSGAHSPRLSGVDAARSAVGLAIPLAIQSLSRSRP
jgi:hypothetical protein